MNTHAHSDGKTTRPWPRFLFVFRGVHAPLRLAELRSSALTLGVDRHQLTYEPATLAAAAADDIEEATDDFEDGTDSDADVDPMAAAAERLTHLAESCGGDVGPHAVERAQPVLSSAGGDVGADVFQWVALPNADVAARVAARCSTVRGAYDVWASASFAPSASMDLAAAAVVADERWTALAMTLQADGAHEPRARMLAPFGRQSWRVDVMTIGHKKPRDLRAKVALMEKLDAMLGPLPGAVELKQPEQIIALIEDCREPEPEGGWAGVVSERVQAPTWLFAGRQLSAGAASQLASFSLSHRSYLGRTTLPPELSYLMAIQARVVAGTRVLDPFCGTCSILMTCASLGAATVGIEVDERVLHEAARQVSGVVDTDNFRWRQRGPTRRFVGLLPFLTGLYGRLDPTFGVAGAVNFAIDQLLPEPNDVYGTTCGERRVNMGENGLFGFWPDRFWPTTATCRPATTLAPFVQGSGEAFMRTFSNGWRFESVYIGALCIYRERVYI